jgi:cytochrome c oxidase subunit 3
MAISDVTAPQFSVDATDLSRFHGGTDAPVWWGIVGLILIEMSVVAAFVISYFYLVMVNPSWPPTGHPASELLWPTASMMLLLVSCVTMYLAGKSVNQDRITAFVCYTWASVALASVVLVIRWQQFQTFDFSWNDHVYGSLVWTISGFHFLHVVSAATGTSVVALLGMLNFFNSKQRIGVVVDTLYWNFVALAWIPFYLILYWVPRMTQTAGG